MFDHESSPRHLVMLLFDGAAMVDVAGPMDAFELSNHLSGRACYSLMTVTLDGLPVDVAGGFLRLQPSHDIGDLPATVDMLLVPGGPGVGQATQNDALCAWLRRMAPRSRRLGSICTGALMLAASDVLDGQAVRLATHWSLAPALRDAAPGIEVDHDAIFIVDGKVWSSGGMTAGIDMALAIIEEDYGRDLALEVARFLVLSLRRGGGQSQFSPHLTPPLQSDPRLARVQQVIDADPTADLSPAALAAVAGMSVRSLQRAFRRTTGKSPAEHVQDCRLVCARAMLENSVLPIGTIARQSGLGAADNLRRAFQRKFGVSPGVYRARFGG